MSKNYTLFDIVNHHPHLNKPKITQVALGHTQHHEKPQADEVKRHVRGVGLVGAEEAVVEVIVRSPCQRQPA